MCAAAGAGPRAAWSAERPLAIRAEAYVDSAGKSVAPAALVVREGKIAAIGSEVEIPADAIVLERPGAVIAPGIIDVHVSLGTMQSTAETANAAEFRATAADLFNRFHRDFDRAARAGVTTVLLAPSSTHLVGGTTFAVKTGGADAPARVLGEGPVKLSLVRQAFTVNRPPTSLQGGLDDLRRAIARAKKERDDTTAFARWARGETAAIVDVEGESELSLLARFAGEEGVRCVPLHANYAAERMADFKLFSGPGILGVYEFRDPIRFTRTPGLLDRANAGFALTSDAPRFPPEMLRVGAAIAMAQGCRRSAALAALTTVPAEIIGATERVGALAVGKDADFVLYSGDPLDLTARVIETFIDGARVYRADPLSAGSAAPDEGSRWVRVFPKAFARGNEP